MTRRSIPGRRLAIFAVGAALSSRPLIRAGTSRAADGRPAGPGAGRDDERSRAANRDLFRRLLLGRARRVRARQGRDPGALRIHRGPRRRSRLRAGEHGHHGRCGIGARDVRPATGDVRQAAADTSSRWRSIRPKSVTRGRTGAPRYRSELFVEGPEQERVARAYIAELDAAHAFDAPIATRVDPAGPFYPAETYHQDFLVRNPDNPYIVINDLPKLERLRQLFPASWRTDPVLVDKRSGS